MPGDVLWFRGSEQGFQAPQVVRGGDGEPLRVGRGSLPFVWDWEGDGDLDLVLGTMLGQVYLARNSSGDARLSFEPPELLLADGVAMDLGKSNAAPFVVDWDGDGRSDLVLGLGDGRVVWCRNRSTAGAPELAAPVDLVGASRPGEPNPVVRVKPAVFDWNADGRLDLVVGDYCPTDGPGRELDAGERAKLRTAIAESTQLGIRRAQIEGPAFQAWLKRRRIPVSEGATHFEAFLVEWERSAEGRPIVERMTELAELQRRLNPANEEHGKVWVYLRQGAAR